MATQDAQAQSDKSTTHTDSSHSHPSNDIVMQWQCHSRDGGVEGGGHGTVLEDRGHQPWLGSRVQLRGAAAAASTVTG